MTPSEITSVTLDQYALVFCASDEGAPLEVALEIAGVPAAEWPAAEAYHTRKLTTASGDPSVLPTLDDAMRRARAVLDRPVTPIDTDVVEWGRFLHAWSAATDPMGMLAGVGVTWADVVRLSSAWTERIAADRSLAERFVAALQGTGPVPAIRVHTSKRVVEASARVAARQPAPGVPRGARPSLLDALPSDNVLREGGGGDDHAAPPNIDARFDAAASAPATTNPGGASPSPQRPAPAVPSSRVPPAPVPSRGDASPWASAPEALSAPPSVVAPIPSATAAESPWRREVESPDAVAPTAHGRSSVATVALCLPALRLDPALPPTFWGRAVRPEQPPHCPQVPADPCVLPFRPAHAPSPPPAPQLALERYAALVAECRARPADVPRVLARHGIADAGAQRALDHVWTLRLAADAALEARFRALVSYYTDWYRRHGGSA